MTISKKSWHYRLHVLAFTFWNWDTYGPFAYVEGMRWEHRPKSLCSYFWSTAVLALLTLAALPLVILLTIGLFAFAVCQWLWDWNIDRRAGSDRVMRNKERRRRKREAKLLEPQKEPGLVRTYLRALKTRTCPMITLTD